MDAPAQMIGEKLRNGLLPHQDETKSYAGYGSGAPCAGCDLAIHASDVEYELVFADERSYAFHLDCVKTWRELRAAPADGEEWRVTCSCRVRIGFAATFAQAEALGLDHVGARSTRSRHVITIART
jgi:hypothetical protein